MGFDTKTKTILIICIVILIICIIGFFWMKSLEKDAKEAIKRYELGANKQIEADDSIPLPENIRTEIIDDSIYVFWTDVNTEKEVGDEVKKLDPKKMITYKIYFSIYEDFTRENARTIEKIDMGEFVINKVPNGTYYCRVVSVRNGKESIWSDIEKIVVNYHSTPDPPIDIQVKRMDKEVRVSWQHDIAAQNYKIMMRSVGEGKVIDKIYVVNSNEGFYMISIDDFDTNREYFCSVSMLTSPNSQSYFSEEIKLVF
tara:strand:- start:64 stop:831 length:768 start_codon:yes stop_codon:yes gene_type:complete